MLTADVIELLKPGSGDPLLVITVGNRLRSDDGIAPYIAEQATRPKNGIIILDAGERPEDVLWKAIEVRPERVVIIDAADFGGEPGEVRAIPEEFIPENPISTHRFPLRVISRLVTEDTGARVDFICIQPESVGFGEGLSDSVRSSAEEIVEIISLSPFHLIRSYANILPMKTIKIYDTSLRDGTQAEEISFSVEDKILVARKLDELGVHYIEGGWPGSNPKDVQFFKEIKKVRLKDSRISAFGSTGRPKVKPSEDHNLKALVSSGVAVACIFGKSWDLHVKEALKISLKENLDLIHDSVTFLKREMDEVFYDAEHFFDGYKANPEYAIKTLKAAAEAGADCLVLCDTNGGTLPHEVAEAIKMVKKTTKTTLGIHCHNDSDLAVANSLIAVELGIRQVQGTINGFGERCGNANLCSIIPNLQLKMGYKCLSESQLARLSETSRFVSEIANLTHNSHLPYVGESAFAHKGGIHVSAVMKNAETYEHMRPELVGNRQRVLISDLSGKSNILFKAKEFGIDIDSKDPLTQELVETIKDLEHKGYQFEGAEASFELLMKRVLGTHKKRFSLVGFRVIDEKRKEDEPPIAEATIMVEVGGKVEHTAAVGDGPINAIDNALRKALEKFYPSLKEVKLLDFKVRVLTAGEGTAASVRVLIESGDKTDKWGTVGVSENVIEASWQALVDSIDYKLYKDEKKRKPLFKNNCNIKRPWMA